MLFLTIETFEIQWFHQFHGLANNLSTKCIINPILMITWLMYIYSYQCFDTIMFGKNLNVFFLLLFLLFRTTVVQLESTVQLTNWLGDIWNQDQQMRPLPIGYSSRHPKRGYLEQEPIDYVISRTRADWLGGISN